MKTTVLLMVLAMLSASPNFGTFGQTSKPKTRITEADLKGRVESPCGVKQSFDEWLAEYRLEWRIAAVDKENTEYLYNTHKILCARKSKTLKVWVKAVKDRNGNRTTVSMTRYELNCRTDQLRMLSSIDYFEDGSRRVSDSYKPTHPKWDEATPDTIGEAILITVCHKES